MTFRTKLVMSAFLLLASWPARSEPLIIYTENYPPYNYLDEHGQIVGFATEKVNQVMEASGLRYEMRLVPWARALHFAETSPDALIFSMTRTPARETRYDWLVPLAESNFYLFTRADDPRPVTRSALRAGVFIGSCVSNDLGCELLSWVGVPPNNIVRVRDNNSGDFRMVLAGRADVYISDINANRRFREAEGYDLNVTKPAMKLDDRSGLYLAGGLLVPQDQRDAVRAAYDRLMQAGTYTIVRLSTSSD